MLGAKVCWEFFSLGSLPATFFALYFFVLLRGEGPIPQKLQPWSRPTDRHQQLVIHRRNDNRSFPLFPLPLRMYLASKMPQTFRQSRAAEIMCTLHRNAGKTFVAFCATQLLLQRWAEDSQYQEPLLRHYQVEEESQNITNQPPLHPKATKHARRL